MESRSSLEAHETSLKLTSADVSLVPVSPGGSVEPVLALVAVDALRVVSAILAHAPALVDPVNVQRVASQVHLFVVFTSIAVSMAVASCELD